MNVFEVYLMMQADSIITFANFSATMVLIIYMFVAGYHIIQMDNNKHYDTKCNEIKNQLKKLSKYFLIYIFSFYFIGVLVPSTKTIATMVILPKLTSQKSLSYMSDQGKKIVDIAEKALENLNKKK